METVARQFFFFVCVSLVFSNTDSELLHRVKTITLEH